MMKLTNIRQVNAQREYKKQLLKDILSEKYASRLTVEVLGKKMKVNKTVLADILLTQITEDYKTIRQFRRKLEVRNTLD